MLNSALSAGDRCLNQKLSPQHSGPSEKHLTLTLVRQSHGIKPDLRHRRKIMVVLVPAAFPAVLQAVSSTSLLAITVFCCVPPLHKPVRKFVRPWVVFHVHRGFSWIRYFQRHQSSLVTFLSSVSSQSVSVAFYVVFLSTLVLVCANNLSSCKTCLVCELDQKDLILPMKRAGWSRGYRIKGSHFDGMVPVCRQCAQRSHMRPPAHSCA